MGFLTTQDEQAVQKEFEKLTGPVTLSVFASELGSENNSQVVALIKEVGALSDKITVKVLNPYIERDETAAYEISNLIDAIIAVSRGEAQLKEESKTALARLAQDVTIKVFATPT